MVPGPVGIGCLSFPPDGKLVTSGFDGEINVWELEKLLAGAGRPGP